MSSQRRSRRGAKRNNILALVEYRSPALQPRKSLRTSFAPQFADTKQGEGEERAIIKTIINSNTVSTKL
jgi:hypothetical protein